MKKHKNISVLLIEDESYDVKRIENTIKPFSDKIIIHDNVTNGPAAISLLKSKNDEYDVVIMDFQIAGSLSGVELIREIKKIDSTLQIIVITKKTINITDFDFANSLIEAGAMWYCTKYPGDIENFIYQPTDFILNIFNAFEKRIIEKQKIKSDKKLLQHIDEKLINKPIIGTSTEIIFLKETIEKYANSDGHVLITGSSGTGKELVARHIHFQSKRRFENFIPINCGSLPDDLIESELFGYEKGSFTGAHANKPGLFEIANNGTIFLDEIAELPKQAQVKLLRVLQDGELDKIGRTNKVKVNVRIIAATNKNLREEIKNNRFREDLFYRLNVFIVKVPQLREHRSDIPLLLDYYFNYYSREMNKPIPIIEKDISELLLNYDWPGNIRQLQNVIQRLLILEQEKPTLKEVFVSLGINPEEDDTQYCLDIYWKDQGIKTWHETEKEIMISYFQFVRNKSNSDADTARKLGLDPANFHRLCKKLNKK